MENLEGLKTNRNTTGIITRIYYEDIILIAQAYEPKKGPVIRNLITEPLYDRRLFHRINESSS